MKEYENWKEKFGYNDDKVASELGVTKAAVCRWKKGVMPSLANAFALEDLSKGMVPAKAWLKKRKKKDEMEGL